MTPVTRADIAAAYARIAPCVRRTPLMEFELLAGGAPVSLKLEFCAPRLVSPRGAFNNLLTRAAPAAGCATASGGNHGAAVAYAAAKRVPKRILPEIAASVKIAKIRASGAGIVVQGATYSTRWRFARPIAGKAARCRSTPMIPSRRSPARAASGSNGRKT